MTGPEDPWMHLGGALAQAQDDAIAMRRRVWRARMRARVLDEVTLSDDGIMPYADGSRGWGRRLAWSLPVAVAAALVGWVVVSPLREPLPSRIAATSIEAPRVTAERPLVVAEVKPLEGERFAEHVDVDPGGKIDVVPNTGGREVEVQAGRARFQVAEAQEPWIVSSTNVSLRANEATFWVEVGAAVHLEVETGAVEIIEGPDRGRWVRSGETWSSAPSAPSPGRAPKPRARRSLANESAPSSPTWQDLADQGNFRAAWAQAQRDGARAGVGAARDLLRLADVARYSGHSGDARSLLLSVRHRFPGDPIAATAAFDLARLGGEDCEKAERWLRTYLREQPHGTMAEEARARLSACEQALP